MAIVNIVNTDFGDTFIQTSTYSGTRLDSIRVDELLYKKYKYEPQSYLTEIMRNTSYNPSPIFPGESYTINTASSTATFDTGKTISTGELVKLIEVMKEKKEDRWWRTYVPADIPPLTKQLNPEAPPAPSQLPRQLELF